MTPTKPHARRHPKERRVLPDHAADGVSPEEALGGLNDIEMIGAPKQLFLAGDRNLLKRRPRVSVVGSREASPDGLKRAARIARILAEHGVTVVSGLALGVDAAALRAAMAAGGRTIAVIGTPLDKSYPKENADLQAEIARNHLLVSQFPSGYAVKPYCFPMRNRTMALVVDASVIVEAGDSSGTLSQGWEALRLNRPLFIMRSILDNHPEYEWPRKMIDHGARVLSDPEDVLEELPTSEPVDLRALYA